MEIVRELREIPNLSLALGFFDGVHLGHQAVINCAVLHADDCLYIYRYMISRAMKEPCCFYA